ncbi:Hemin transport protein hemS [Edwardsiella tarda]|uniref:Hemin-degrading factor n=1 Tax=Edwardsiella tarda ATCC 15947 = NBRC 105688 TaxID=667121 RepID=A0AC61TE90_EDWTA|nr:hemin-degrading factor [Edwardsiella tarda]UAL55157.1 hemin-degrading factor [Edwardsiella tarda]UCP98784.1 hemin-degrading factor [Edwardsiella tarda ATCC 15947 = NBRC 105688]STD29524.1 Hemin transport protein hemS [Edwardsiella tarda]
MSHALYTRYLEARQQQPQRYARDLAQHLGVSEGELTRARVGHDARRLQVDAATLLEACAALGEIKAITRNEYAVHEHLGRYTNLSLSEHGGLILNPRELDLRLFLQHWHSVFALCEQSARGERLSLQCFDQYGDAVHKIYATEQSDMDAWQALVERFASPENPAFPNGTTPPPAASAAMPTVDSAALEREWRAMTDVHQFFPLLRRHGVTRQQAFAAIADDLAYPVDNGALQQILEQARHDQNEIMIFVGNRGCVQIFTGQIAQVTTHQQWLNVFNPRFTLHLQAPAIASSWVTRKPTRDGIVSSLELFAADGSQIAQLFGQRTEGNSEQPRWREQLAALAALTEVPA